MPGKKKKINVFTVAAQPGRRTRRRRRKVNTSVPAGVSSNPVVAMSRGRRGKRTQVHPEGEIVIRRRELLTTVKVATAGTAVAGFIALGPAAFTWLQKLSTAFERYKFTRVSVYWKPSVGTAVNGSCAYGVDWKVTSTTPSSKATVVALTPSMDHAVWQSTETRQMVLPASRLQSRAWYTLNTDSNIDDIDKYPATLKYYVSSNLSANAEAGDFWIDYTIVMTGTA